MATAELFDLAVNRALSYALRTGPGHRSREGLQRVLELWYLQTRFAYRIPLDEVIAALLLWPGEPHRWRGGRQGGWHADASGSDQQHAQE